MSSSGRNPSFGIVRHCFMVSPQARHRIVGVRSGAFPIAVALGRFQTGARFLVAAPGVVGDNAFSVHFNMRMDG